MKVVVDNDFEAGSEGSGEGATGPLAAALVALEERFEAERPEVVVVADDSEMSLAAALVATKLLIPLEATAAATAPESANGRVLAQLATPAV
jgi:UDP-N-acetylglucosamine 2-epimerase